MCDWILPDIWSFLCNFLDKNEKKLIGILFAEDVEPDFILVSGFRLTSLIQLGNLHSHLTTLNPILPLSVITAKINSRRLYRMRSSSQEATNKPSVHGT